MSTPTRTYKPCTWIGTSRAMHCSTTGWTRWWPGCRFPPTSCTSQILYDEPREMPVAINHRLRAGPSVTFDDIAHEPIPKLRDCDPAWNAFWRIDPRPDGRGAPEGPLFDTLDDWLELIAAGQAVAVTTGFHDALATRPHHRPLGRRRTQSCRCGKPRRGPQPSGGGLLQTRRGTPHRPTADLSV